MLIYKTCATCPPPRVSVCVSRQNRGVGLYRLHYTMDYPLTFVSAICFHCLFIYFASTFFALPGLQCFDAVGWAAGRAYGL